MKQGGCGMLLRLILLFEFILVLSRLLLINNQVLFWFSGVMCYGKVPGKSLKLLDLKEIQRRYVVMSSEELMCLCDETPSIF